MNENVNFWLIWFAGIISSIGMIICDSKILMLLMFFSLSLLIGVLIGGFFSFKKREKKKLEVW